jgi:two-component system sensor histidine kinase CpxA
MRSLFSRLFVSFALVTVATTVGVSAYYDQSLARRTEQRIALVSDAMRLHGEEIAEAEARGDRRAVEAALGALAEEADLRVALVDAAGERAHAGDALPAEARALDADVGEVRRRPREADEVWLAYRPRARSDVRLVVAASTGRTTSLREVRIALLLLVTALVSFVLARVLTRPIRTLRDATHRIAAGDTSVRVGKVAGAGEEIASLAADFDRMTGRIEDLLGARERLLRDVSHELRSPLARLTVALGIARQRGSADAALLDRMEKESERLGELVSLVLTMAKLEEQHEVHGPEDVRLDELVTTLVSDASFEAEGQRREVKLAKAESVVVRGDAELLRQAAENVVRNAIRFTAEGTRVDVELARRGDAAELCVRDHGPGVPDEALTEIFRPFTRVEAARERTAGGVGLGLAITERAVRLHHGSVVAENAEGGGLRVTIRLPVAA